jgi:hypothetical protein
MKAIVLLICLAGLASAADAQPLIHCNASEFYSGGPDDDANSISRVEVTAPAINLTITENDNGKLLADLAISRTPQEVVKNAPVEITEISEATIGDSKFKLALRYLAIMTNDEAILSASSYVSYQVKRKNGETYVVALAIYRGKEWIGNVVMYPTYQVVGICK